MNPEWNGDIEITDEIFNEFVSFVHNQHFKYQIEGENELTAFLETAKESDLPENLIGSGEELLTDLIKIKEYDMLNHKTKIKEILIAELAEKYYGNKERIRQSLKSDRQLHVAINVVLDDGEYKKILAIK
jgi:carboxyl-terminal processing protease